MKNFFSVNDLNRGREPGAWRGALDGVRFRQALRQRAGVDVEPLHHVGTVTEEDEDLALVSARAIYDEQPWIHMILVPRGAIREAIRA